MQFYLFSILLFLTACLNFPTGNIFCLLWEMSRYFPLENRAGSQKEEDGEQVKLHFGNDDW